MEDSQQSPDVPVNSGFRVEDFSDNDTSSPLSTPSTSPLTLDLTDTDNKSTKKAPSRGSRGSSAASTNGVTSFLKVDTDKASRASTNGANTPDRDSALSTPSTPKIKFDAKTLLSPRGKGSRQSPEIVDDEEDDVEGGVDATSMYESIHRVEARENAPKGKRRKLEPVDEDEDEDGEKRKKSKMEFQGSNGLFSDWKKDEKKKNGEEVNRVVFDLTGEDDVEKDDVMKDFLEEDDPKLANIVVLGWLENAQINMEAIPHYPSEGMFRPSKTTWPRLGKLKLVFEEGTSIVRVRDQQGFTFGRLRLETTNPIYRLLSKEFSRFHFTCEPRLRSMPRQEGEREGDLVSRSVKIELKCKCPRTYAKMIGTMIKNRGGKLINCPIVGNEILYNPHDPTTFTNVAKTQGPAPPSSNHGSMVTRTAEEVRSDVMNLFDAITRTDNIREAAQPAGIVTELLKHQRQGLYFLIQREMDRSLPSEESGEEFHLWKSQVLPNGETVYYNVITGHELKRRPAPSLGGILADMMGLGKTLSILSLVVTTLPQSKEFAKLSPRHIPPRIFKCNSKATLLVCPLSTVANWEKQVKDHIKKKTIKYYIYHGPTRTQDAKELAKYDLVITSYHTLVSEVKRPNSPVYLTNWFRVVLDEAHQIRNPTTSLCQAACELEADRRWAVTGTPVQNRLDDLGALIKFLRIKPFDDKGAFAQYILAPFKVADTEILPKLRLLVDSITLRRMKDHIDLPKRSDMIERLDFSKAESELYQIFVADSKRKVKTIAESGHLGGRSYAHVLKAIMRMRLVCAHGEELLNDEDRKLLTGLTSNTAILIPDDDDEAVDILPELNQTQVFEMLDLLKYSDADKCAGCTKKILKTGAEEEDDEEQEVRADTNLVAVMTGCLHLICPNCLPDYIADVAQDLDEKNHIDCRYCGEDVQYRKFEIKQTALDEAAAAKARVRANPKLARQMGFYRGPHTKTIALLKRLKEFEEESKLLPDEPPIKSVIFSSWTNHLDLIQIALTNNSITSTRLDGSMSRKARAAALEAFSSDPSVTTILVSIGAGGLGLNLTSANKVFMMEPQFNPAAEAQAVDRVHRLGQRRDVEIVRYIMQNSFEENMLALQAKKIELADLTVNRNKKMDKAEKAREKMEALKSLFR